jgi:hypothetical protein
MHWMAFLFIVEKAEFQCNTEGDLDASVEKRKKR